MCLCLSLPSEESRKPFAISSEPRLRHCGTNESQHSRSVSGGGAKHTGQRSRPQKTQAWLPIQSNLHETETDLEISLNC